MYGGEQDSTYDLRRRRLLGGLVLAGLLLVSFALNGWQLTPIWSLFENDEGTFTAGDPYAEWIYAVCDGEQQQVTVLRNGRLEGAAALDSLRNLRFPDWCDSLPTVDNPELAEWQAQLERLQALTASGSSAARILDVAETMPVSALYLKPISDWIHDDPTHASSFLDTIARRPMRLDHPNGAIARARRDDFSDLIESAVDVAVQGEVAREQVERWLASGQIAASGAVLQKLARIDGISDGARALVLERLGTVRWEERNGLYMALAPDLVHASKYAALLDEQLRELPRGARSAAAQQLLARPDASVDFATTVLSSLRRGFNSPDVQLEIFMALADKLGQERNAPLLLTGHLKDISGSMQRRLAAQYLLGLDRPGESAFALSVLGAFADFHPMSRPKVIYALMQSAQFTDRAVQEASLIAIQLEIRGPAKGELLTAMSLHRQLDGDLHSRISAELHGNGPRG